MTPPPDTQGLAIIEGTLCRLDRHGTVVRRMPPLGGFSVAEFYRIGNDIVVREQVGSVLAGISNLYRITQDFGLVWLAHLPSPQDAYAAVVEVGADHIVCRSTSGRDVRLDLRDGRVRP